MNTAVIQMGAGSDKAANIVKAVEMAREAIRHRAEFILLPELFVYRGPLQGRLGAVGESIPGPSTKPFLLLAGERRVFILAGSIYEKIRGGRNVFNTSVFINPRGEIQAKYRKIHLFNAVLGRKRLRESDHFQPGTKSIAAPLGAFKAGLSICYDLRFADLYQSCARAGADVLCVPSAFTHETGKAHWKILLQARAIENLSYVLAPNQIGHDHRGVKYFGHSLIVDPWGRILAEASGDREEILYARLDREEIQKARRVLPKIGVKIGVNSRF